MSTLSKTRNSFERLVRQKGAEVHWHRETGGIPCPCLTPEGFRDPEWHRELETLMGGVVPQGVSGAIDYATNPQLDPAHSYAWIIQAGTNQVGIGPRAEVWNVALGDALALFSELLTFNVLPALRGISLLHVTRIVDSGVEQFVTDILNPGTWRDSFPFNYIHAITYPRADLCNDDGIISNATQDQIVKAFVQPAFIGTRSRSNQLLVQAFGEIQADDHIGIFPMESNGLAIDFADWSNSGTDWIEFNGMRFIAVSWNLLPAPDNANVSHHWEVALRRINQDVPSG